MDRALLERMIGAIALVLLLVIVAPALLDGTREASSDRLSDAQDDQDVRTEIIVLNEPRESEVLQEPKSAADPLQPDIIVGKVPVPTAKAEEVPAPAASAVTPAAAQGQTPVAAQAPVPTETPKQALAPAQTPAAEVVAKQPVVVSQPVAKAPAVSKALPARSEQTSAAADAVKAAGFAVQLGSFGQAENARKYAAELSTRGFATFVRSGSTAAGAIHRVYAGPRPSRDAAEQLAATLGSAGYQGIVVDLSAGNGMR